MCLRKEWGMEDKLNKSLFFYTYLNNSLYLHIYPFSLQISEPFNIKTAVIIMLLYS